MNPNRVRIIKDGRAIKGPVVYWMSRDQRAHDNWALLYAKKTATDLRVPLVLIFCLSPTFLDATLRQYQFMIEGLKETIQILESKDIPLFVLLGDPTLKIPNFLKEVGASLVIADFDPLKVKLGWKKKIADRIDIPFYEIDTRNIVPCWIASNKQEFAAYTIRPKIYRLLEQYLEAFPTLTKFRYSSRDFRANTNWKELYDSLKIDKTVKMPLWIKPGEKAAHKTLKRFIREKLELYPVDKNNPSKDAQSNLSPYLHFGQISSQRIYSDILKSTASRGAISVFLEELLIRREQWRRDTGRNSGGSTLRIGVEVV